MKRIRRLSAAPPDLNLVPLLDMISLLVQVLLLHAHFGGLTELQAKAAVLPGAEDDGQALRLTVDVVAEGFVVRWQDEQGVREAAVDCRGGCGAPDTYDRVALGAVLGSVKARHPLERSVVIRPRTDVSFEVLSGAMDACRQTPQGAPLFPDVSLSGEP